MIVYMDGILKVVENWGRGHPQIGQKKKRRYLYTFIDYIFENTVLSTLYKRVCYQE